MIALARRLLNEGRFPDAVVQLQSVLRETPEHREALYLTAVCHRYSGNTEHALAAQNALLHHHPGYARGFQERGHLCLKLSRLEAARSAYERAVTLNPGLLSSWIELAALYQAGGRSERAAACDEQVRRLHELPRELTSAMSTAHEGDLAQAEKICRSYLQSHPRHPEAMRVLAKIATDLGVLDQAAFLLQSAVEFAPDYHVARFDYAQVLLRRQHFRHALEQVEVLLAREPDNPAYQLVFANASAALGEFRRALDYYERLIAGSPENAPLFVLKGHALKSLGERQGAIEAYQAAAAVKPDFGDAWWSLANLKVYRFEETEISLMQRAEAQASSDGVDRQQLCFALGKGFEDRREYERSFDYYARGNAMKLAESGYRAERTEREFAQQQAVCTRDFFETRSGYGVPSTEPIFIVGLPRSGSTLVEQILASHPLVDGTIELPNIIALAQRLDARHKLAAGLRYPANLAILDAQRCERFGQEYLEATRVYRREAPFFTDKTPNNFRHIGLIHLLFPNARIIDARRTPMACCFSNFKQLFGEGQYFSYGLEELGRYYRGYTALMDHWDAVLPGKLLRVQYEDVVADLETQVRRLLDFLGLPFDSRCLEFHRNQRAIHTPSSEQVRQRIYQEGVGQWQHFEPFLEPLKRALGIAATGPVTDSGRST